MHISPYLNFNGDCEAAFQFYAATLGGEISSMMKFAGTPMEKSVPAEWANKIVHAGLKVGNVIVMGSDAPPGRFAAPQGGAVCLSITDPAEAERVFNTLAEGGTVQMPYQKTYWAVGFGMATDRFGTPWMVNCGEAM